MVLGSHVVTRVVVMHGVYVCGVKALVDIKLVGADTVMFNCSV